MTPGHTLALQHDPGSGMCTCTQTPTTLSLGCTISVMGLRGSRTFPLHLPCHKHPDTVAAFRNELGLGAQEGSQVAGMRPLGPPSPPLSAGAARGPAWAAPPPLLGLQQWRHSACCCLSTGLRPGSRLHARHAWDCVARLPRHPPAHYLDLV